MRTVFKDAKSLKRFLDSGPIFAPSGMRANIKASSNRYIHISYNLIKMWDSVNAEIAYWSTSKILLWILCAFLCPNCRTERDLHVWMCDLTWRGASLRASRWEVLGFRESDSNIVSMTIKKRVVTYLRHIFSFTNAGIHTLSKILTSLCRMCLVTDIIRTLSLN